MDREKKNKQLMNIYQELTKQGSKLKDTNLFSLKHVLKELSKQKKTPSTSLHTTASKRNQQSQQSKTNQPLSPQTSYRSRLQLTKRNLWIDLINLHSQQYIQQDQIAITEYRTNTKIDSMMVADWKSPYYNLENQQKNNNIQHQNIDNFHHWKDLLQKRLQQKKS